MHITTLRKVEIPGIPAFSPMIKALPRQGSRVLKGIALELIFILLLLIWIFGPYWLHMIDPRVGNIDQSIWLNVILALISYLILLALSWWLLLRFWHELRLPSIQTMVLQFNQLNAWQQLGFFYASFALLILVASACLMAVC